MMQNMYSVAMRQFEEICEPVSLKNDVLTKLNKSSLRWLGLMKED